MQSHFSKTALCAAIGAGVSVLGLGGSAVLAQERSIERECAARLGPEAVRDRVAASIERSEVRRRVLAQSPALAALCEAIAVREAEVVQAGLRPNPEIELEVEEFGGTGDVAGFDAAEATLLTRQRFETSGKRSKRQRMALAALEVAKLDYQIARAEHLAAAEIAFADVLAAQARVALQGELVRSASASVQATRRLVSAGAASPVETTRAEVELASAEVLLTSGRRRLASARAELAASWGAVTARFERAEGRLRLPNETRPPSGEDLIERSPRIARLDAELEQRRATVVLEDARAVPDVTIAAGVRRLEDPGDTAFVASFSVPLPVFDRNQGTRDAARARVRGARYARASLRAELSSRLSRILAELDARAEEVTQLRDRILPSAQEAFEGVRRGYAQGRFRGLDVIDAQRRLFELRLQEIDALRAHAELWASIERLIGFPLVNLEEEER